MDTCQRCDKQLMWNSGPVMLIGETHTRLCERCRNDWHAYFLTLPEYEMSKTLMAQKATLDGRSGSPHPPVESEWRGYIEDQQQLMERLFALGMAWIAVPVEFTA